MADPASVLQFDLRQVIHALSDALDLVGVDDVAHGKRVGIMASHCARALRWSSDAADGMLDLGMLHDIGVSSTRIHGHLVDEFDWEGARAHCETGHALLASFAPLAHLALPVRHHHTRWDRFPALGLDPAVAEQANLVFLTDRVDALAAQYRGDGNLLLHIRPIRDRIEASRGSFFAPHLVDCFLEQSAAEAFWLEQDARSIQHALLLQRARQPLYRATMPDIRQLAWMFSNIVDAKSPFTAAHSEGVARLARHLAERAGIAPVQCDKLEIAGLLHDLGKLRVPDEILDKPGALSEAERKIINTHSFETYQILNAIRGFEDITRWAAWHHEEPDGTGYPFRLAGRDLPLEARILRVADIFQAMVQNRPYRKGLTAAEAVSFMQDLAGRDRVDREVVALLAADPDSAMQAALPRQDTFDLSDLPAA